MKKPPQKGGFFLMIMEVNNLPFRSILKQSYNGRRYWNVTQVAGTTNLKLMRMKTIDRCNHAVVIAIPLGNSKRLCFLMNRVLRPIGN